MKQFQEPILQWEYTKWETDSKESQALGNPVGHHVKCCHTGEDGIRKSLECKEIFENLFLLTLKEFVSLGTETTHIHALYHEVVNVFEGKHHVPPLP